ncbi:MAG TPA: HAMP domain-containing sensor histidine kinase [Burkholderiaceae bacterium]
MRALLASALNRLVLAYGVGLLLAFGLVGGLSLVAYNQLVARDIRQTVLAEHQGLREVYLAEGRRGLARVIDDRVNEDRNREAVYLLVDPDGHVRSGHLSDLPPGLLPHTGWVRFPWNADARTRAERDDVVAYVERLPDGGLLVTGHTTGEQQHLRELVEGLGAVILGLLAVLTGLLGWLLRRGVDRALKAPLDTVDRVAAGHLRERVPERGGDDAFARLDRTLNRMLDRIHDLVGGIQSSTDAIAHDLRTPLMRLKTRLEQARLTSQGEARDGIDAALVEVDELIATFNSLLRLARIEGSEAMPTTRVALDEVAADAVELWQAVAEARGQTIVAELAPAAIAGDGDLLFQLLANLLDNAIKYAPRDSRIALAVGPRDGQVELTLGDAGPGIAPADRERVFDRFVRLEAHRGTPGNGLGLSLVRAIAVRHGAELHLASADPGLVVRVRFPRWPG